MKYPIFCALVLALTGCSPNTDPIINSAVNALDEAYVMDVKPADASFTNCSYAQVETRHVVRCGISYGSTQLAHVGYWEIEHHGSTFTVYAMNGKALSALDRITQAGTYTTTSYPGKFKGGQGRTPLDMAKVNATLKS